jgi:hypothetical protein
MVRVGRHIVVVYDERTAALIGLDAELAGDCRAIRFEMTFACPMAGESSEISRAWHLRANRQGATAEDCQGYALP